MTVYKAVKSLKRYMIIMKGYQQILGRLSEHGLSSFLIASEVQKGRRSYRDSYLRCVHGDSSCNRKAIRMNVLIAK